MSAATIKANDFAAPSTAAGVGTSSVSHDGLNIAAKRSASSAVSRRRAKAAFTSGGLRGSEG